MPRGERGRRQASDLTHERRHRAFCPAPVAFLPSQAPSGCRIRRRRGWKLFVRFLRTEAQHVQPSDRVAACGTPDVRAAGDLPGPRHGQRRVDLRERPARSRGFLGRGRRRAALVSPRGTACSSGRCRMPSGSSAGSTNIAYNCLDRHLRPRAATRPRSSGRASRARRACSPTGIWPARSTAARTRCWRMGVKRGDRVAIYMPMIPELPIAMLACARIGAVAHRGLRRVLGGGAARPDQRRAGQGA